MCHVREPSTGRSLHPEYVRQAAGRSPILETLPRPIRASTALTTSALALAWLLCSLPAQAIEISQGELQGSLDTTLSHGLTFRVGKRDDELTGVNSDDGDRNYARGLVSNTSKIIGELELDYGNFGAFARVHGFIDFENENGERERTSLSRDALGLAGKDLEVLDLYVTGAFDAGDTPIDVRLGNHVLNWGESTFIQNGVNVINPFDVSSLRTPGAELRDALEPVPLASLSVAPTPELSLEGFYQLKWEQTEVDPSGTYFSTNDYATPGGSRAFLSLPGFDVSDMGGGFGPLTPAINADLAAFARTDCQPTSPGPPPTFAGPDCQPVFDNGFLSVTRNPDREPDDSGQWGIAVRYLAEDLNNTEFGFYVVNHHSRLPLVSAKYGTLAGYARGLAAAGAVSAAGSTTRGAIGNAVQGVATALAIDRYGKTARYFVEYPEDLPVFGVSFNTLLGASGWALQGEYSFHPDSPLQREEQSLFVEGLSPLITGLGLSARGLDPLADNPLLNRLGTYLQGYVERDVSQIQATATKVFGPSLGADSLVFITEAALTHVHDMPDQATTPIDSPGIGDELADATSYGYRAAARLDYNNAIGAARLSPYVQFQHDVNGSSPGPGGPFVESRTVLTLGAGLSYLERWQANVSYTRHAGDNNYLSDRDFISASVKYSF